MKKVSKTMVFGTILCYKIKTVKLSKFNTFKKTKILIKRIKIKSDKNTF